MARQVLPIVGAVAGFAVGGPTGAQIGFALGSLVGNAVDPIEMQGRKLGDAPTQVAAEGGARAIVYGKGCIRATVVMERGGRRVIRQRDRSGGKGGGPTTVNERALWTFAIGLGEPVAAILRIWENEKLVYDVTPTSTIPEDTAQFAEKFRFYDGNETQLPDPALEALHGVGDTPYYRGTAYMVFPQYDLTDFGETVPTYRVEVASSVSIVTPGSMLAIGLVTEDSRRSTSSADGATWSAGQMTPPGTDTQYLVPGENGRYISYNTVTASYTDDLGITWTPSVESFAGFGMDSAAQRNGVVVIAAGLGGVYRSTDNGESFSRLNPSGIRPNVVAFVNETLVIGLGLYASTYFIGGSAGSSWSVGGATVLRVSSARDACSHLGYALIGGHVAGNIPAISLTADGLTDSVHTFDDSSATAVSAVCSNEDPEDPIMVVGTNAGELYWNQNDEWHKSSFTMPGGVTVRGIAFNGSAFAAAGGSSSNGVIAYSTPGIDDWAIATQPLANTIFDISAHSPDASSAYGQPIPLASIVSSLHSRSGQSSSDYSVSELSELTSGVVIESTVTAAEAINSIIGSHFADPSDYDGKIHYIKRGKPVVLTLTEDDLIDEPDEAQRNNAIEYPKKVHFLGQRADLAYASSKSTSSRYSGDVRSVGEITIGSPETYDEGMSPAEVAAKLIKVLWTESQGEREWLIPDNYLGLVPTDCVGLSYRNELVRCRILNVEDTPGQRKLRMVRDRQSDYTANLTEIPNPPSPTPPQSSVIAPTILKIIDTSALTDNADTLHYLVALSGANDNWAGAVLQQMLGGSFSSIDSTTLNSIMGTVQNTVYDASPYYTDTTNQVIVRLFTEDELEAQTEELFLTNGGAFFLSWEDSSETHWEIMQYRDCVQDSNGDWVLSHLMRGRKNTPTAEHPPGATFVWIDPSILREAAQTSWLGTVLTHRAVSNGQSPDLAPVQDNEYVGNSQREWPVAGIDLNHDDPDILEVSINGRHRFGSSMAPIQSVNWLGMRVTSTDGVNTETLDTTSYIHSFDVTGWGSPITVTVWQINRLTGLSDPISEVIA